MHNKLETMMGKFGEFIYDNPFKVILLVILLLIFPISHVPQIKMDTSTEGFMHDDDPVLIEYNKFRAQFGRDERIVLAVKSDSIFTLKFLETLRDFHEEIEEKVPYLDEVTSLYNVRNTRGKGDRLITDDLLEPFPETQKQVDVIKKQAMASHFYKDLLLSSDGKMTTMVIETDAFTHVDVEDENIDEAFDDTEEETQGKRKFLTDGENAELLAVLKGIIQKYEEKGLEIYLSGSP